MKVRHYEFVKIAEDFLKENYDMNLGIPIEFNPRLKKVLGRFIYKARTKEALKIEVSIDFMLNHPREHIIDVFKHELVHYALFSKGLPYNDGDYMFESELKRLGVNSTHTYEYLGELHKYECSNCGKVYEKRRRLSKTAYCGCSNGPNLEYKGIVKKTFEPKLYATGSGVCQGAS